MNTTISLFRCLPSKQLLLILALFLFSISSQSQTFCDDIQGRSCDDCPNYTPSSNPDLNVSCEGSINVILVIDESNSIGNTGAEDDVQEGVEAFLQELECTPVNVAIIEFGSVANYIVNSYTPVANVITGMTNYFNGTGYNGHTYNPDQDDLGGTNWQAALMRANSLPTADLLLMFTDGVPTAYSPDGNSPGSSYSFCGSGNTTQETEIYNAVELANTIKNKGTHMFILGIGSINSILMIDISANDQYGPSETIATADYYVDPNFSTLSECFASLANSLCPIGATDSVSYICAGESEATITITLANNVPAPYIFTLNGPGQNNVVFNTSDDHFNINVNQLGDYTIKVEASGTCFGEATLNVNVQAGDPISVTAGNIDPVCSDVTEISLSATSSDAASWSWESNGAAVFSDTTAQNPTVTGFVNGEIFTVMITDANGCTSSDSTMIIMNPMPEVKLAPVEPLCLGTSSFQLESYPATGGVFSGPGVSPTGMFDSTAAGVGVHTITYTYTDPDTGCSASASIDISVVDCCEDETAFAYNPEYSNCFIGNTNSRRWGWSNGALQFGQDYSFDLIAGAGRCLVNRGTNTGTVTITYNGSGDMIVTYNVVSENSDEYFELGTGHIYIGCTEFPDRISPGRFPYRARTNDGLTATAIIPQADLDAFDCEEFYFIAHAEVQVCAKFVVEDDTPPFSINFGNFSKVEAYPVPFKDVINLRYKFDFETNVTIDVVDMQGRIIHHREVNNYTEGMEEVDQIDLSRTDKQILFLRVTTNDGVTIKKIISQK